MGPEEERALLELLNQRYGDGSVYFLEPVDAQWYCRAVELGLLSEEGYLTVDGARFCKRRNDHAA